jgi:hypothetical protein
MMDFIIAPTVTGIVFLGIYKLFELFVRRRERMTIIEKMGDKFTPDMMGNPFMYSNLKTSIKSFATLRIACLLLGMGLGLLVGIFLSQYVIDGMKNTSILQVYANSSIEYKKVMDIVSLVIGASTLLFGGLGLLVAYLIESKQTKNNQ